MLIGLEHAHAFSMSIFGGVEHLNVKQDAERASRTQVDCTRSEVLTKCRGVPVGPKSVARGGLAAEKPISTSRRSKWKGKRLRRVVAERNAGAE